MLPSPATFCAGALFVCAFKLADACAGEIHLAVRSGDLHAVTALVSRRPGPLGAANELDANGNSPLMLAALTGNVRVAEVLLHHGAQLEARDSEGFTPLHTAVERSHPAFLRLLLARGAQPGAAARDARTPLHSAAQAGLVEVGKVLLDHGARWDARERNGANPLHGASLGGHYEFVRLLVSEGADVDAPVLPGRTLAGGATPLQLAALGGYPEVVALLLRSGANPHARSSHGGTTLHYAATGDSYTRRRRPSGHLKPPQGGHVAAAALLIESKVEVNSRDDWGRTPLHLVVPTSEEIDMARLLLARGADPAIADRAGNTVPMLAERAGDRRLLELLGKAR